MNIVLKKYRLKEKPIQFDNNCQFHAIVDQCLQNGIVGWDHIKLRKVSILWLFTNKDVKYNGEQLKKLFDLSDNRLKKLSMAFVEWGDEATLFALSNVLQASIRVYCISGQTHVINPLKNKKFTFHLGYYNNVHYVSTIPCV